MLTIIDYGMGNLGSLLNMLKRIGVNAVIGSELDQIKKAEKIVLPGVGSFDAGMHYINTMPGLRDVLEEKVMLEKVPTLGVCLGMQLFTQGSEEGRHAGLGWISGHTRRFPRYDGLKVPHMGWNIAIANTASPLTVGAGKEPRYYFAHSYYVEVENPAHSVSKTHYGLSFDSAVAKDNIYGVQFHPEKSHRFGSKILKNFAEL